MPRPEPVTMTTRPSQMPIIQLTSGGCSELLAQLVLVELAVVVPGQRFDEDHPAGTLVVRDAVPAPLDELESEGVARLDADLQLHGGHHDLAPLVVGLTDHTRIAHGRMCEQRGLDLG